MNAAKYWMAFGVGVAAGAAVALLYAPQSGEKTRRQLRRSLEDAGDYLDDAGDYIKEKKDRLSDQAERVLRKTRNQVEDVVERASDAVKAVSDHF
ncbi:MAG: YtxH domain-containing protein [Acidobacteriaceae bacterium]